jgi:hypothetical protein
MEKDKPNQYQKYVRIYPMKKYLKAINQILGFWSWLCVMLGLVEAPITLLIFKWPRKVIPAFRKMMSGERRSYLRVSDEGLEYCNWPSFRMRCEWDDVKNIKKGRLLGDVLTLERVEGIGIGEFAITIGSPQIHLSSLVGWPHGGLEEDLRKYAPQLFKSQGQNK